MDTTNPNTFDSQRNLGKCQRQKENLPNSAFAKQAKMRHNLEDPLATEQPLELSDCSESTNEIQTKLKQLLTDANDTKMSGILDTCATPSKPVENTVRRKKEFLLPYDVRLPSLNAGDVTDYHGNDDDTSDSDSEFFPDWSSVGSHGSNDGCHGNEEHERRIIAREIADDVYNDVLQLSDDDFTEADDEVLFMYTDSSRQMEPEG
nr:uncharacterized protein LOC100175909 [Ciona intestinalis]|eukprot:XP_002122614.1 uncharacterized protein LOC100175909 [Ciona intestinalis]